MEQETVLVPEELVGVRLDKVLSELFSDLSRSYIQQLIKDQQVLINGKNEKANYKCRLNDQIDITIPEPEALDVVPEEMDLDIVHEDDYVIVVNAEKIKVTGKKLDQKVYYNHSDYVGGMKETTLKEMLAKHPERVIEHAVKGMLPKKPLGRQMYTKLFVYAGPDHKHAAQKPETLTF